jgi:polar amino acid transport system permease protein
MNTLTEFFGYLPELLPGLGMSLILLVGLVVLGTPLAFLLAFGLGHRLVAVRWFCVVVVEISRGMPSLILLYLVYFGLPSAGITLTAITAAAIALAINYAGYVSETVRAGIDSVPAGQYEAAAALALNQRTVLRFVTLPQSIRVITPPMLSWVIVYFQTTSIGFAIAVPELMSVAYSLASANYQYLAVFLMVGVLYAVISIPGSQLVSALENRAARQLPSA